MISEQQLQEFIASIQAALTRLNERLDLLRCSLRQEDPLTDPRQTIKLMCKHCKKTFTADNREIDGVRAWPKFCSKECATEHLLPTTYNPPRTGMKSSLQLVFGVLDKHRDDGVTSGTIRHRIGIDPHNVYPSTNQVGSTLQIMKRKGAVVRGKDARWKLVTGWSLNDHGLLVKTSNQDHTSSTDQASSQPSASHPE